MQVRVLSGVPFLGVKMTTAVTVKCAGRPVFVYQCGIDEKGESTGAILARKLEEGEETFYAHSTQDILVTEVELPEDQLAD